MIMEHKRGVWGSREVCVRGFFFFSDHCIGPNVTSFYKIVFYILISHLFVFKVSTSDTYVKNNCVNTTPEHIVI